MSIIQRHPAASRVAESVLREWIGLDAETIGRAAIDRAVRGAIEAEPGCDDETFAARLAVDSGLRDRLVEEVIVAESWFFRDPQVFELLRRQAVARAAEAGREPLRILCVPCAAGEEPFSVAMALLDAGVDPGRFVVDAVDVSRVGLKRAKAATYSANAFRGADLSYRDRWFRAAGGSWTLLDAIRHRVRFEWGNLLEESFLPGAVYDVIFCRNLLIYLTTDARRRAEQVLDRLLAADGLLVLGAAEPPILKGAWVPAAATSMFTLRRGSPPTAAAIARPQPPARPRGGPTGERAAGPPAEPAAGPPAAPSPASSPGSSPGSLPPPDPSPAPAAAGGLDAVLREAGALANAGRHDDAIRLCQRHEHAAGPAAELSFLLAMLHQAAGDADRAEACLHKTLYLDATHEEALLALALAAARRGDRGLADKYRQAAARVLARKEAP